MAVSQLPPLLLLLVLALLLKSNGTPTIVTFIGATASLNLNESVKTSAPTSLFYSPSSHSSPSTEKTSTTHPSTPHSETHPTHFIHSSLGESPTTHLNNSISGKPSTTYLSSPRSGIGSTHLSSSSPETNPTSPPPETNSHHSSGPPVLSNSSPPTPAPLSSTSLTLHWSPTPFILETQSSSTSNTTSKTGSSDPSPGEPRVPELHRNPGVVVALCLLVVVLVIGSVVLAVRCCQQRESKFQMLDEVSMGALSERSSFANQPPK